MSLNDLRQKADDWVESRNVQGVITVLIVVNAITLGMETSKSIMAAYGDILVTLDRAILAVFVVEILLKLFARYHRFFLNGWNVFDFIVVGISLIPASGELAVLRSLRVLRTLRLISKVKSMRKVVNALVTAIPGMLSVMALISLIFFVAAVIATKMYGNTHAEWFGTLGASFYTLFQVMTLESWSMGIVRPVMEVHPGAWLFFLIFILTTSFAVLNLFIGIIVDAMQSQKDEEAVDGEGEGKALEQEIRELRGELAEIKQLLKEKA